MRKIIAFLQLLFIAVFLGAVFSGFMSGILHVQFFPALFSLTTGILFAVLCGMLFASAVFFGRIYCTFLCPLGIMQDFFIFLGRAFSVFKVKYHQDYRLRRIMVFLCVAGIFSGVALTAAVFDPYSIFVRAVYSAKKHTYYSLVFSLIPAAICIVALKKGRLFCNTFCPAGALLGEISAGSLYSVHINKQKCTACGICERICRAQCIQSSKKNIDFRRCVMCLECMEKCPHHAIRFSPGYSKSRRDVIRGFALTAAGFAGFMFKNPLFLKIKNRFALPPGAGSLQNFLSRCTGCQLCSVHCPAKVLTPGINPDLTGMVQPALNFNRSYCEYECNTCSQVCPTGAIQTLTLTEKKLVQIGIAEFRKELCIVYKNRTDCGACAEHCPTKAVRMVDYEEGLRIPEVTQDICVGCGACEFACPAVSKAIAVKAHQVHKIARSPVPENAKPVIDVSDDFAF